MLKRVIRRMIMVGVLVMVYLESGPWTAAALFILTFCCDGQIDFNNECVKTITMITNKLGIFANAHNDLVKEMNAQDQCQEEIDMGRLN